MMLLTMLYTTVAMWGAAIMNGVIEEKSNRVVEVIVSSIPTSDLFAGKLIGVGGAGLTQFLVWALTMAAVGRLRRGGRRRRERACPSSRPSCSSRSSCTSCSGISCTARCTRRSGRRSTRSRRPRASPSR